MPKPVFSFKKSDRLVTNSDFVMVLKKHRRLHSEYFTILYQKSNLISRLGVAVGKKCHKSAVVRNRVKRLIREHYRINKLQINQLQLIVQAKKPAGQASKALLNQDLCQLFEQLTAV